MLKGQKFFCKMEGNCSHGEQRIVECDASGVAVQVLSTAQVMFNYSEDPGEKLDLTAY
jgi:aminocarboxymuconate-semialdehyde decarboxylase